MDISLDRVVKMRLDTSDPEIEKAWEREQQQAEPTYRFGAKNEAAGLVPRTERYPELKDLYAENDEFTVTNKDRNGFDEFLEGLVDKNDSDPEWPRRVYERAVAENANYYILEFSNLGGLVMPVILGITYADGSEEELRMPAEIWRRSPKSVRKLLIRDREITQIVVDPMGNGGRERGEQSLPAANCSVPPRDVSLQAQGAEPRGAIYGWSGRPTPQTQRPGGAGSVANDAVPMSEE